VAREFGAGKILLAEINDVRLKQAGAFGFDRLVDAAAEDLAQVVKEETDGLGADVTIVAAPAAAPQEQAPEITRKRGTICLFASLPSSASGITLNSRTVHYGEQRVVGTSDSAPVHVEKAVELICGETIPVGRLATHVLGLDEIMKAYALMQTGEALRVVLKP
jgi:L-iditol 2-dehydrogenase